MNWPKPVSVNDYFDQDSAVTVQLTNSATPTCWTSTFPDSEKNIREKFKAKSP